MTTWTIRPLAVGDADACGRVHVGAWRDAYRGLLEDVILDGLDARRSAERWRATAADLDADGRAPDGRRVMVADGGGGPVGMVVVGPPRDADPVAPLELHSLNVDPAVQGRGVGRALVAAVLPPGSAYLWVLEGNARAVRFYERLGFALDGGRKEDPAYRCTDLRMIR